MNRARAVAHVDQLRADHQPDVIAEPVLPGSGTNSVLGDIHNGTGVEYRYVVLTDRRSWLRDRFGLRRAWTALVQRCERTNAAAVGPNDNIKVTKIETFVLKNSWVFVKISTDAGITGWGEMLKDDAKACAAGALEVGRLPDRPGPDARRPSLAGDSSRRVLSRRPDQDGDLERHRSGALGHQGQSLRRAGLQAAGRPDARPGPRLRTGQREDRRQRDEGEPARQHARSPFKYNEGQKFVEEVVERFKALRERMGTGVDIGVEFHGAVQPPTAMV